MKMKYLFRGFMWFIPYFLLGLFALVPVINWSKVAFCKRWDIFLDVLHDYKKLVWL